MSWRFIAMSTLVFGLAHVAFVYAGPREVFLASELKFIDFQSPAPEYTIGADVRSKLKDHFSSTYNRILATNIRFEHEAGRVERAIAARELMGDAQQLRTKLAHARTRLAESRAALSSIKGDFENIFIFDLQATPRTRMGRMRGRFEKEVAIPMRGAHTMLMGVVLKLKEIQ
ncbi:MAG: hypothetical protein AAB417_02515 [Patescibacteria group bacterium]